MGGKEGGGRRKAHGIEACGGTALGCNQFCGSNIRFGWRGPILTGLMTRAPGRGAARGPIHRDTLKINRRRLCVCARGDLTW